MSTNDVPGYKHENHDELHMGCWAEHKDGSLIFVESTEASRVIYSIFDMAKEPPIEYRDAMPESSFKATFSWETGDNQSKGAGIKWTWHDKTPFPWDRIIKAGGKDGIRYASADHVMTAAERVAESLRLRGQELDRKAYEQNVDQIVGKGLGVLQRIWKAVATLPEADKALLNPRGKRVTKRKPVKRKAAGGRR